MGMFPTICRERASFPTSNKQRRMMSSPEAIRLRNVVFGYDSLTPVLHVDELGVEAGRRVFLYGPSGSGKTTLLGLITGVLQPQRGTCMVLGKELTAMSMSARDQHR